MPHYWLMGLEFLDPRISSATLRGERVRHICRAEMKVLAPNLTSDTTWRVGGLSHYSLMRVEVCPTHSPVLHEWDWGNHCLCGFWLEYSGYCLKVFLLSCLPPVLWLKRVGFHWGSFCLHLLVGLNLCTYFFISKSEIYETERKPVQGGVHPCFNPWVPRFPARPLLFTFRVCFVCNSCAF